MKGGPPFPALALWKKPLPMTAPLDRSSRPTIPKGRLPPPSTGVLRSDGSARRRTLSAMRVVNATAGREGRTRPRSALWVKVQEGEDQLCRIVAADDWRATERRRVGAAADRPGRRDEPLSWPVFSRKTWCQDSIRRRLSSAVHLPMRLQAWRARGVGTSRACLRSLRPPRATQTQPPTPASPPPSSSTPQTQDPQKKRPVEHELLSRVVHPEGASVSVFGARVEAGRPEIRWHEANNLHQPRQSVIVALLERTHPAKEFYVSG